jgi:tetratricopeptide (TPR) repeat protein
VHYWIGEAYGALKDTEQARAAWSKAASFKGDFQQMSVQPMSEMTYYSALSLARLGHKQQARRLFRQLQAYARKLLKAPAKIDYFATSLPTMLLFEEDIRFRQETAALFLAAQAQLGLGEGARAKMTLQQVLKRDPNHALARDLRQQIGAPGPLGRAEGSRTVGRKSMPPGRRITFATA